MKDCWTEVLIQFLFPEMQHDLLSIYLIFLFLMVVFYY